MNREMKLTLSLLLGGILLVLSGCNPDPIPPQFAFMTWRLRCEDTGGCIAPEDHRIENIDGEENVSITCSANISAGNRALFLSAEVPGQYGIAIRNVRVPEAGGAVQAGGFIRVTEGANIYEGVASANPPPDTQPASGSETPVCRISNVSITSTDELRQVTGQLYCRWIANEADAGLTRELTAAGADPANADLPVNFEFQNCEGL